MFSSPEVKVVEASAGSGKTYALAKRYVQLALNPDGAAAKMPIRHILALTFTNKAAFEMKARIIEFFKRIAFQKLSSVERQNILTPVNLSSSQAGDKAYAIMENIIRHYNFFQVQTIDTFINALLSGCAFKIGLTANFRIKTNYGEYLQYSLDHLIDAAGRDGELRQTFERFLHHYMFLENRSGWFPRDDMLTIITALFNQKNTYGGHFQALPVTSEDIVKVKAAILKNIKALESMFPDGMHAGFRKAYDKFVTNHQKGFDIDAVSNYFARDEVPVRKGVEVPRDLEQLWIKIRRDLTGLSEEEAYASFNPYLELFSLVLKGFYAKAAKDDCLFLNELNRRARDDLFLKGEITTHELYYRLATSFHHYLIDEFQDTSRLQWGNLKNLIEEALSTGGTLFYVGDRKQAIYGFRGGDVSLFDEIRDDFQMFNVRGDVLINNFRSQKAIVDLNNRVFSLENLDRFIREHAAQAEKKDKKLAVGFSAEDLERLHHIFESAHQTYQSDNDGGYVHIEHVDIGNKDERDLELRAKVVALIYDLRQRFSYSDIAILTRGNREIARMTNWLLEEGIPVESERTSDVRGNAIVREIIAFLQFLESPIDNSAFAEFILGDIFTGVTGLNKQQMHDFIFSLNAEWQKRKDVYLYARFRERYPEIWTEFIDEFFRNVGLYPLYELLITMYKRFQVFECGDGHQGFLMHFLELVKKNEEEHGDLASFLDYFEHLQGEELYIHVTGKEAVRVLTIHKSKGLEFPAVIFPYLGMDIQIGTKMGEYQPSYVLRHDGDQMALVRLKKPYRLFSENLNRVHEEEYKKSFVSELNSLYVAMTRPRYEFYGFIPKKVGQKNNPARLLIPEDCFTLGTQRNYPIGRRREGEVYEMASSVYPDWIGYLKDEFLDAGLIHRKEQRFKGEVMHYLLSHIGNLDADDADAAVARAVDETANVFPYVEEMNDYTRRVKTMITHPDLKQYFYCDLAEVFTEKEVVDKFGRSRRCDRLIITDDQVRIVDFKSTRDGENEHEDQIREYKMILAGLYPEKSIHGYILYMDSLGVETV